MRIIRGLRPLCARQSQSATVRRRYRARTQDDEEIYHRPYRRYRVMNPEGREYRLHNEPIPLHVLADRDRRANCIQTTTERLFGDPKPGQSALDQRLKAKGLWP